MSREIQHFAVIGAGNMGAGIAQKIATEGANVTLVDLDDKAVDAGLTRIETTLRQGIERGIFKAPQVEAILGRVSGTSDWQKLADVDLVIEAVFENLEVKQKVFRRLGEVCRPDTILGTNTSSFYVRELAQVTAHPERVVGLHYFYHPAMNRLVEVVGHEGSSSESLSSAWAAQESIGKTPIRSADAPGFVVNRYFVPWLNEAVRLLEEGVADCATIDWAAKRAFRIGMGPFELMNVTGVPIALHAASTLGREVHAFYAPADTLQAQVDKGENWDLSGGKDETVEQTIADRLRGVVFYVAGALVDEGVSTPEDADIGARVGLRWSRGPFQLMNGVGMQATRDLVSQTLDHATAAGLTMPSLLSQATEDGIPLKLVSQREQGALTRVAIDRPDAMNALNEEVVQQLELTVNEVRSTGGDRGMVLAGSGKAFIAGADIKFFVDNLRADTFGRIYEFTRRGQELLASLSGAAQPVVARVHGLSLGGGSELALACDYIACSPKASFGFPETGLGIYPGLGGTQRLTRRVGLPIARYLVFTGHSVDARRAEGMGLCDHVTSFGQLDAACESLAEKGSVSSRSAPEQALDPEWTNIWNFFSTFTVDQILGGEADTEGDERLAKICKTIGYKSPHALRLSERIMNEGAALPLEEALALELEHLEECFSHSDALEGLSALLEDRRPKFQSN